MSVQTSLLDLESRVTDPTHDADTKTISYWGFSYTGRTPRAVGRLAVGGDYTVNTGDVHAKGEILDGHCCILRVTDTLHLITPNKSLQIVTYSNVETIRHFWLKNTEFHELIEARLVAFAEGIGLRWRVKPTWKAACGRVRDGVI